MITDQRLTPFTKGKSEYSVALLKHFLETYKLLGALDVHPTKSMIGIVANGKNVAWITQIGKNYIHVVFPFKRAHADNLCFQKIAEVPGTSKQFNHHLRILHASDVNEEVKEFMKLAADGQR